MSPITVGYVEIGLDWAEQFSDANFLNQRLVPDVDTNGQPLDSAQMKQAFYLEPSAGGTSTRLAAPPPRRRSEQRDLHFEGRRQHVAAAFRPHLRLAGRRGAHEPQGRRCDRRGRRERGPRRHGRPPREGVMAWVPVNLGGFLRASGSSLCRISTPIASTRSTIAMSSDFRATAVSGAAGPNGTFTPCSASIPTTGGSSSLPTKWPGT